MTASGFTGYTTVNKDGKQFLRFECYGKIFYMWIYKAEEIHSMWAQIIETFKDEAYAKIDCKDANIIDVGAYCGDTALHFIQLGGAKYVWSFEDDMIEAEAISINMLYNGIAASSSSWCKKFDVTDLEKLAETFKPGEKYILKMDCEGCEYNVIANAKLETLKKFDQIFMEFHHDITPNLTEPLKYAGFTLDWSPPKQEPNSPMITGYLNAVKPLKKV